ncbi:hypothetical protein GDO78_015046 [Eleutherodactylus coqui]|uniref:Dynactin subunit 6 n=1 Tax=Eleutherodactylus coqui TaxID=57060 RepID=A0A8J6EM46_ELECQ|nr:hypothetical protein GDO78_015046 [Eleutherodactylus coqui]
MSRCCHADLVFINTFINFFNICHFSVKIAPGAVVCVESEIKGDVTIGPRTVVHPKARIYAEAGPIIIGEGNLIEEQAFIRNSFPENIAPDAEDVEPKAMIIGTNNVFEVGCCILSLHSMCQTLYTLGAVFSLLMWSLHAGLPH